MFKKIFILISLFSFSLLMYFPLNNKEINLNTDDICYYSDQPNYDYVKACDKGYYCYIRISSTPKIGICLEYNPVFKKYKEECSLDSECGSDYKCSEEEKICTIKGIEAYKNNDAASKNPYYYCSDENFQIDVSYKCQNKGEELKDKCFLNQNDKKSYNFS